MVHDGKAIPTFYHIHNGQSETTQNINPRIINANYDKPPQRVLEHYLHHEIPYVRNGDFFLYAELFDKLYSSFNKWSEEFKIEGKPFVFPDPEKFETPL